MEHHYEQILTEFEPPIYPQWSSNNNDEPMEAALLTLRLNAKVYRCHKVVLGYGLRSSKFFRLSFSNDIDLSVLLPSACHSMWETVLSFMHTAANQLTCTVDNVIPLFKIAHILRIHALASLCIQWFKNYASGHSQNHLENAFKVLAASISFAPGLEAIENLCERCIASNIHRTNLAQILHIDLASLKHILQFASNEENVTSQVAVHYLRHVEEEHREVVFFQLVDHIKLVFPKNACFLCSLSSAYGSPRLRALCLQVMNENFTALNLDELRDDRVRCAIVFACSKDAGVREPILEVMYAMDLPMLYEVLDLIRKEFRQHRVRRSIITSFETISLFVISYAKRSNDVVNVFAMLSKYVTRIGAHDALYLLSIPTTDRVVRTLALSTVAREFQRLVDENIYCVLSEILNVDVVCAMLDRDDLFVKDEDQVFDEILRYCELNVSLSQQEKQKLWSTCRFTWLSDDYCQRASTVHEIPKRLLELGREDKRKRAGASSSSGIPMVASQREKKRLQPRHLYGLLPVAPGKNSIVKGLKEMKAKGMNGIYLTAGVHVVTGGYVSITQAIKIHGAGRDRTIVKGGGFRIEGKKAEGKQVELKDMTISETSESGVYADDGLSFLCKDMTFTQCCWYGVSA